MSYDLKPIKAPRAAGALLRILTALIEHPPLRGALASKLLKDAGVMDLRHEPVDEPLPYLVPALHPPAQARPADLRQLLAEIDQIAAPAPTENFAFVTAADFVAAYLAGTTTPEEVAQRFITFLASTKHMTPPMGIFIAQNADDLLVQARASALRYKEGRALGPLDGVPVAVKDEVDLRGYPTMVGTRFLGTEPAAADAEAVARLRTAGALLLGKANMHEIGIGVTGINPHHGPARNPYDPGCFTGGSSSGPAAAVAAGFCPIAVGADGGGSIRIPAALCGVVGLKPTITRVSEHGAAPLCWSVAHVGPLAVTGRDAALAYAFMAGPDPKDPNSLSQPPPTLAGLSKRDLKGVRLGVYTPWFEDAEAEVVEPCKKLLAAFQQAGAEVREIELPQLALVRTTHLVIIVSEMATAHLEHYRRHRKQYGHDTRMNLALAHRLKATDYVQALRLRARICRHFSEALQQVDALVTPATACTAGPIHDNALRTGESDLPQLDRIMRFAPVANLTGLPAISFPAGYNGRGLPVGFQAIGRPFDEALLLRLAVLADGLVARRKPQVYRRLMPEKPE